MPSLNETTSPIRESDGPLKKEKACTNNPSIAGIILMGSNNLEKIDLPDVQVTEVCEQHY